MSRKIQTTKDYRLFHRSDDNRPTDAKKRKALLRSMKQYGFLACFPIVCGRDEKGRLVVKDGQHRLAIAESLGLPVHWVEESVNFDIATINSTSRTWVLKDYAQKFAANGKRDYQEGIEFSEAHKLPLGTSFALLAGTTSYGNVDVAFRDGSFKIRDRKWADAVAGIYVPLVALSDEVKNARFIEACMAACRVNGFDSERMIQCATRCREKLLSYSTRDAYLDMMEEIYNFGRSKLLGLKAEAMMAMRDRNAAKSRKKKAA